MLGQKNYLEVSDLFCYSLLHSFFTHLNQYFDIFFPVNSTQFKSAF